MSSLQGVPSVTYLTFTIDTYIERVSITGCPIYNLRGPLGVEVMSCSETVEGTGSNLSHCCTYTHSLTNIKSSINNICCF